MPDDKSGNTKGIKDWVKSVFFEYSKYKMDEFKDGFDIKYIFYTIINCESMLRRNFKIKIF